MQFVIVTGLSGSGKSGVINVLEDIGYYCVDNMPPRLIPKFADLCRQSDEKLYKVAFVADIRGGDFFDNLPEMIKKLGAMGIKAKLLFLDANDQVLMKRYKETRRKHPLDEECHGNLSEAISAERQRLLNLRAKSDYYIDTSSLSVAELKNQIKTIFLDEKSDFMMIKVMSFGFKYGVPPEADLVFGVRCLPNPYYIAELKPLTGLDEPVRKYVMNSEVSHELRCKLLDMFDFLLPLYIKEGKSQLVIAFGCTGGKHRSVTFAEQFYHYLDSHNLRVHILHRDIDKDVGV